MTAITQSKTCISTLSYAADSDIVHVHFTSTDFPISDLIHHYAELDAFIKSKPSRFVYTFESIWMKPMTYEARMYNAAMMEKCSSKVAAITSNTVLRSFLNLYMRVSGFTFPIKAFGTKAEGVAYLSEAIEVQLVTSTLKSA